MKQVEFMRRYGIPADSVRELNDFVLNQTSVPVVKRSLSGSFYLTASFTVADEDAPRLLAAWNVHKDEAAAKKEQARQNAEEAKRAEEQARLEQEQLRREMEAEEQRVKEMARSVVITSTQGFEGYRITRYGGYVSGDEVVLLSDSLFSLSGYSKDAINDSIKDVRLVAIEELKAAAAELGCNAVVGLDFDYVTVDRQRPSLAGTPVNETFVILTANGTAVVIEPLVGC